MPLPGLDLVLAQHLVKRLVVDEDSLRQVASRSCAHAFSVALPVLRLPVSDPIAALAAELSEQAAAVQDRAAFAVEALSIKRSDDLDPMNSGLEAERGVRA